MDPYSTQMVIMNQIGNLSELFIDQIRSLLVATAFFILGLIVAEVTKYVATGLFKVLRWDAWCERSGWGAVLARFRPGVSPSGAVGIGVFWVVLLSFLMFAFQRTEIGSLVALGRAYFEALPGVGEALAILILAGLIARGLGALLGQWPRRAAAPLLAGFGQSLVGAVAVAAALPRLGVAPGLANPMALILLAGAVLALVLAWTFRGEREFRARIRVPESHEAAGGQP